MTVLIYDMRCMSRGDKDDLDCIFEGPVSNEIAAMAESPQLTTRLLAEPAGHCTGSHPGSTAELPHREGRTKERNPFQGPCQPLPDELPF